MTNIFLYDITQKDNYSIQQIVDDLAYYIHDNTQGIIINEYSLYFLKATYWTRKNQKSYRYNPEKGNFDILEEEIVNVVNFGIEIEDNRLLVFGSKQMAQRIITLIAVASSNAYIISEYLCNFQDIIQKLYQTPDIVLVKMKLVDITIEKGVMVNCSVNLEIQDDPKSLVLKYINNIVGIVFRLKNYEANITVYKSGKITLSKINEDEKDELIQNIIHIVQ